MKRGPKKKKVVECATKEEAIQFVKENIYNIEELEPKWRDDEEVMMLAVTLYGENLEHVSDRLKNDRDIVLAAIKRERRALSHAARELRDDREMRNIAYQEGVFIVDPVAWDVFEKEDARMINQTILRDPVTKRPVLNENGEEEFSVEKTRNHPIYIKYKSFYDGTITAAEMMALEKRLIASRIRTKEEALEFVSTVEGARAFGELPGKIREDKDVALKAVSVYGGALRFCTKEHQNDREVVLVAINEDPYALTFASKTLRNDPVLRKIAYDRVGPFVVDPDLRAKGEKVARERKTGRIRRPRKEFNSREERELDYVATLFKSAMEINPEIKPEYPSVQIMIELENLVTRYNRRIEAGANSSKKTGKVEDVKGEPVVEEVAEKPVTEHDDDESDIG